jgi:IclR family acetate operon transcriptional repressor
MAARNHIDLVEKTLRVLEALGESARGVHLKAIVSRVGLVKSSVYRILYTLKELGYVEQPSSNGAYRLTLKLLALSRKTAFSPSLVKVARPHLTRLRDELEEPVWLAEQRAGVVILVDVVEAPQPLRLSYGVGDRCPLHATALGKAIAAHMSPQQLNLALGAGELPRFTPHTITARPQLLAELARVRRRGFAVNEEETVEGAVIVGSPVLDSDGHAFAAISVSTLTVRCSARKREKMIRAVRNTAAAITADLAGLGFCSLEAGKAISA